MEGGIDREMDNKRLEDCEIKIYYFDHNIWDKFPLNNLGQRFTQQYLQTN